MKYLLIEKSKRVSVKPYQRKGKYVIGHQRVDPRNKGQPISVEEQFNIQKDRKFVAEKIGVPPENLDYVGIQSFRPMEEKYMYLWNVNDPSSKKHMSTVTGEIKDYPKQEVKHRDKLGSAFIGVPDSFAKFIQATVPIDELRDLKSIEEFSFHDFGECKTIPKKPYLSYLEKEYKKHPDYGGMYFHDIARFVLDSTNKMFNEYPTLKKSAFLHEIGHHQWWYHTTVEDRKEFISIWERERIGKIVSETDFDRFSDERWEILETPETTKEGKYKVKNIKTGEILNTTYLQISSWGLSSVTAYANANAHEGFAEAYAEFRAKSLSEKKFPETYHLLDKIFKRRKKNVMVEATEGPFRKLLNKKGEGVEVKKEPWKGNVLEWVAPKRTIPLKTSEARTRNWETFKGTIKTGEIDDKLPLTDKSQKYWEQNKSELGYANLRGLSEEDIRSILSAVRRGEASVNVNRMGKLAFYKLKHLRKNS
jgi:hypothetical protein